MFGKLLGSAARIVNSPLSAVDKFMADGEKLKDEDRVLSSPLESVAEQLDEADKGWKKDV